MGTRASRIHTLHANNQFLSLRSNTFLHHFIFSWRMLLLSIIQFDTKWRGWLGLFSLNDWTRDSPIKPGECFLIYPLIFWINYGVCMCLCAVVCACMTACFAGLCLCLVISKDQLCCRLTRPHIQSTVNQKSEGCLSRTSHTHVCRLSTNANVAIYIYLFIYNVFLKYFK